MEYITKEKIGVGIIFIILIVIGNWFMWTSYTKEEIKEIDCFDKYNNKMIGQTCLSEPIPRTNQILLQGTITVFIAFVLLLMHFGTLIVRGYTWSY
jgi:Ca2+/Na+ antiporter